MLDRRPRKASEVEWLDTDRDAGLGELRDHAQHGIIRLTEDADLLRVEELFRAFLDVLLGDLHVGEHRIGVGVHLDDRRFGSVIAQEDVETEELGLPLFDHSGQRHRVSSELLHLASGPDGIQRR
jgi:hypothetical protein